MHHDVVMNDIIYCKEVMITSYQGISTAVFKASFLQSDHNLKCKSNVTPSMVYNFNQIRNGVAV